MSSAANARSAFVRWSELLGGRSRALRLVKELIYVQLSALSTDLRVQATSQGLRNTKVCSQLAINESIGAEHNTPARRPEEDATPVPLPDLANPSDVDFHLNIATVVAHDGDQFTRYRIGDREVALSKAQRGYLRYGRKPLLEQNPLVQDPGDVVSPAVDIAGVAHLRGGNSAAHRIMSGAADGRSPAVRSSELLGDESHMLKR